MQIVSFASQPRLAVWILAVARLPGSACRLAFQN